MFSNTAYVKVKRNRFDIRHLESGVELPAVAQQPFTTSRCLIGDFSSAQGVLKAALKQLVKGRLFAISPKVLIHPIEMVEGGLAEVEERVIREVAMGAGAYKVVVWVGRELTDAEVLDKLRAK